MATPRESSPPPEPDDDTHVSPESLEQELKAMWRGTRENIFDQILADVNVRPSAFLRPASERPAGGHSTDLRQFPSVEGYTILRQIGVGGMGEVFEALHLLKRERVALKLMRPAPGGDDAHRQELFDREVRVLARLAHPFIATIRAAGQTRGGRRYLTMELLDGVSLLDFANARGKAAGGFTLQIQPRLRLFCEICDGIQYAHERGVVHRDLKPSNILVVSGGRPKVLDFGLASLMNDKTVRPNSAGTLRYMSPEQLSGDNAKLDPRSDIYALGVILYELLTDQPPYRVTPFLPDEARRLICESVPPPPTSINHGLPPGIDAVAARALEKQPGRRYKSAAALAKAIREGVLAKPKPKTGWQLFWDGLLRRR